MSTPQIFMWVPVVRLVRLFLFFSVLAFAMNSVVRAQGMPKPGVLQVFSDWIVGCDNINGCHATSLSPEDPKVEIAGYRAGSATISVKRNAAERSPAIVQMFITDRLKGGPPASVKQLMVDDAELIENFKYEAGTINLPPCSDAFVINKLLQGKMLYLVDEKGDPVSSASLGGLREALLHMDTQQKRLKTESATVADGCGGGKAFKGPTTERQLPVIRVPSTTTKAASRLTGGVADKARAFYKCQNAEDFMRSREIKYVRLDRNNTLAIIPALCGTGAYNVTVRVAIVDNQGRMRAPRFDMRKVGKVPDQITNGWWNETEGVMGSSAKARGVGDCGWTESHAWDGLQFRLTERREMTVCRGSVDFITTWRARVEQNSRPK